eukprot:6460369-Amphidinium_carterae.1
MLKRLACYLKGNGRVQQSFSWQDAPDELSTCRRLRSLGPQAIIREPGEELPLRVYVDSVASSGMARRVGLGSEPAALGSVQGAWHSECVRRDDQSDDQRSALPSHGGDAATPIRRGRAEKAPKVTLDLERLNNTSPLLAPLWLGWLPAAEATAVKEGQQSISSTIMLMVLWFCCAVSFWLGVNWKAKKETATEKEIVTEKEVATEATVEGSGSRSRSEEVNARSQLNKVWTAATGECFHSNPSCYGLRNARSVEEYRQCQLCCRGKSSEKRRTPEVAEDRVQDDTKSSNIKEIEVTGSETE